MCIEKEKHVTLVCFLLPLKRKREKISDTCNLFTRFGDPWPSCFIPSHLHDAQDQRLSNCEMHPPVVAILLSNMGSIGAGCVS